MRPIGVMVYGMKVEKSKKNPFGRSIIVDTSKTSLMSWYDLNSVFGIP